MSVVWPRWYGQAAVARATNARRRKGCEAGAVGQAASLPTRRAEVRMGSDAMPEYGNAVAPRRRGVVDEAL